MPITPNSVERVNTIRCGPYELLPGVDLKQTRIERLKQYARSHGVLDDPAGLAALIGKKSNQIYNLLSGMGSFGEKVARSIEEKAGLPNGWLDSEAEADTALTAEVAALALAIERLPEPRRHQVLKIVRDAIEMAQAVQQSVKQDSPQLKTGNG